MENNQSTFIGKGKQNEKGKLVLNINISEAEQFFTDYKGKKYLRVHVSKMKEADNYGRTHTCFTFPPTPQEETPEAQD